MLMPNVNLFYSTVFKKLNNKFGWPGNTKYSHLPYNLKTREKISTKRAI